MMKLENGQKSLMGKLSANQMTLVIMFMMLIRFFQLAPTKIAGYPAEQYLISYKYGFIARGLMGTLLGQIPYMSIGFLYLIGLLVELFMSIAFLLFLRTGLKHLSGKRRTMAFVLAVILTMSPMSPAFTYAINNFGRFDAILIMLAALQCLVLLKGDSVSGIFLVLFSFLSILVHPIYVFTYFITGELLLLYRWSRDTKKHKYWLFLFILNTALVCGLFLYFESFRLTGSEWTADSMYANMQKRTDFDLGDNFRSYLTDWYFGDAFAQLLNTVKPFPVQPWLLLLTLFLMLPYDTVIVIFGRDGIKKAENVRRKIFSLCFLLSFIATIPAFVIQIDYGRWCAGYFFSQMMVVLFCYFDEDPLVTEFIENIKAWSFNHPEFAVACLIYMCSLGYFKDINTIDAVGNGHAFFSHLADVVRAHLAN